MSPPTEQLVRDYLNRLSVAARGRLTGEDRQALVMRTRDFIERNASRSGPATAMQVATLLSRLGDPAALVGQEQARLAAIRGEPLVLPDDAEGKKPGVLRRRSSQASWHWPRPTGSQSLRTRLLNGSAPDPDSGLQATRSLLAAGRAAVSVRDSQGDAAVLAGGSDGVPADAGTGTPVPASSEAVAAAPADDRLAAAAAAGDGMPVDEEAAVGDFGGYDVEAVVANGSAEYYDEEIEPPIWIPRQPPPADSLTTAPADEPAAPGWRPSWPFRVARRAYASGPAVESSAVATAGTATAITGAGQESQSGPGSVLLELRRRGSVLLAAALSQVKTNPVEALAVTLLGLGGVIYPPIWLLGAVVALLSRVWDYRDKWAGLVGPVLLLVIGTTAGISLSSPHASVSSYVHEGWMYADVLSRIAAALGATYLAWRLVRGRRVPMVPPWNKPHRVG